MFSVVIPLYNKSHTIEKTIASVLSQTFDDYEVIIVNDGSTDNGVEVIKRFTNDPRVRIVNQQNQGVSAARNLGVAKSNYEYIAFLDGDDEWMPGFLMKIKEAIEKFPEAGMYGSSSYHRNQVTGEEYDSTLNRFKYKIQLVDFFENPATMPHTSAVVVSKKVFNQIDDKGEGFPIGMKCCEDWSCFYRMAFRAPAVYVGQPLGIRNNNVQGQITGISKDYRFNLLKHVVDFYNLTYKNWLDLPSQNSNYRIFLKYDIRHRLLRAFLENDYRTANYLLTSLSEGILDNFYALELLVYNNQLKYLAIVYIYFTKIIWRTHGFPIVGHSN